jgi:hypothetical protein
VDPLAAIVAHGGTWGLLVEIATALGVVVLGLAFWVGNRRDRSDEEP